MSDDVTPVCYQVNLQPGFGGGERYTVSFARALDALGVDTVLFAHPSALYWEKQLPGGARVVRVTGAAQIGRQLPGAPCWLAFHTLADAKIVGALRAAGHWLTCFAHMPLYGRSPAAFEPYELVFGVSQYVLTSLRDAGIATGYAEALYGTADLGSETAERSLVRAASPYDWDPRKVRDRLFGFGYQFYDRVRREEPFVRQAGTTLGIVSRITPIKQFPLLFGLLAPVLARHPAFSLEIFGAGGYASVRDLRRALRPIRDRVRFWGQQSDVRSVYRQLDYLLTGLPEKEALGLNVIEAQACGCPVLAVEAPPFTETVGDGATGLFYSDPRSDQGAAFERLLERLEREPFRIDPARAEPYRARFSMDAMRLRVARVLQTPRAIRVVGDTACA